MTDLNYQINGVDINNIYVKHSEWSIIPSQYARYKYTINGLYEMGQVRGLGDSSIVYSTPTRHGMNSSWVFICSAQDSNYGVKSDGTLWAWGHGGAGQLGQGNINDYYEPTQVGTDTNWKFITAYASKALMLKTDGTLWVMGTSVYLWSGVLTTPTQISIGNTFKFISTNGDAALAIHTDGSLWSWGSNNNGNLGNGGTGNTSVPTKIDSDSWSEVSIGYYASHGIKTDGTLWGWGDNGVYEVGDNTNTQRNSPVPILGSATWKHIASCNISWMGIKSDGTLWGNGWGLYGQLGSGNEDNIIHPTQIGSATNWDKIVGDAQGYTYLGLKTDGTLWGWGYNAYRQLGLGDTNNRLTPTQIGTATNWTAISMGAMHASMIAKY